MYGALTDTIRKLLLDHKMLTRVTKRREAYTEFLRRLWGDEASKDVVFSVHGEEVMMMMMMMMMMIMMSRCGATGSS